MENKRLKLLVVDDDEDDIYLVKQMLKEGLPESDLIIEYAMTGDEAIEFIDKGEFDLYLIDLQLGKANGLSLLKYLKSTLSKTTASNVSVFCIIKFDLLTSFLFLKSSVNFERCT